MTTNANTLFSLPGDALSASLDPMVGGTANGKPIWDLETISENLNRTGYDWYHDNYGELDDGILNFGFWSSYGELLSSYYVNEDGSIAFNEAYYGADFSIFNPAQIAAATNAIGLWNDLIAIDFQQTGALDGDINYGNTYTGGAQAYAYLPFGSSSDSLYQDFYGFVEAGRLGGDVWVDGFVASNFFPLADSYYAVTTLIHETGHALGLSHPGDYDALDDDDGDGKPDPITYANDAAFAQDSLQYSIMSYFDAYETGAQYIDWTLLNFAYPSTPQVHDIAAIQAIYGADTTTRTGDTVYGFNSTADRSAFDFTNNTRPIVTIWDAGGNDTIDFSGWNTDSTINLNEGAFSSGGGSVEFLTLEQVNANRAALGFAPRSQDTFAFYEALKAEQGLKNGLFKDNVAIAYGAVIENAVGGGGNDMLIANQVANKLSGGAGSDTVSYETATSGVTANLQMGMGFGGAAGDTYTSIENLKGSAFADTLIGNAGNNVLDGGAGTDTVSYESAGSGVTVNLLGGTATGAGTDSLISIENVTGSGFADTIVGSSVDNVLNGGAGNDSIYGGAGKDTLIGMTGDDYIEGGDGADTIYGGDGNDLILGGAGGDYMEGGAGSDFFVFRSTGDVGLGGDRDIIRDFTIGLDKIFLHDLGLQTSMVSFESQYGGTVVKLDYDLNGIANAEIYLSGVDSTKISLSDFVF